MEVFWSPADARLAYGAGLLACVHAGAAIHHHLMADATLAHILGVKTGRHTGTFDDFPMGEAARGRLEFQKTRKSKWVSASPGAIVAN